MIDNINLITALPCIKEFERHTGIEFKIRVNRRTGEIKTTRRKNTLTIAHIGKFEGFRVIVYEVQHFAAESGDYSYTIYHLILSGSIHKNVFHGRNY